MSGMNMSDNDSQTLQVKSWSRPIRIVFLIDPQDTSDDQLNSIITECLQIWAGRFSPILPTDGKKIDKEWWNLLIYYDPDIIYSTIPLSDELFKEIYRTTLPADIIMPYEKEGKHYGSDTVGIDDIKSLGIGELIQFHSNDPGMLGNKFAFIESDTYINSPTKNFAIRNFGTR